MTNTCPNPSPSNTPRWEDPGETRGFPGAPLGSPAFNPYWREAPLRTSGGCASAGQEEYAPEEAAQDPEGRALREAGDLSPNPSSPEGLEGISFPSLNSIFQELSRRISQADERRKVVEWRMEDLRKAYIRTVPRSRLGLRPWTRTKDGPPYAIYWIRLNRRHQTFDDRTWEVMSPNRPRWFRRLKIRTYRELGSALHWAGLDASRKTIHLFGKRVRTLNEAHTLLCRSIASLRTMIRGRAAGLAFPLDHPPFPEAVEAGLGPRARDLLGSVWKFAWRVEFVSLGLHRLSEHHRECFPDMSWHLQPFSDRDHPFGHLHWQNSEDGATLPSLDTRTMHRIHLPEEYHKMTLLWEKERQGVNLLLKERAKVFRRMMRKIQEALDRTAEVLQFDDSSGIVAEPTEFRYAPLETEW
jgi:hypothetical protein